MIQKRKRLLMSPEEVADKLKMARERSKRGRNNRVFKSIDEMLSKKRPVEDIKAALQKINLENKKMSDE